MGNNYLSREDAPVGPATWQMLDETMVVAAKSTLAGRRILPIQGPYGLGLKAVSQSDSEPKTGIITSNIIPLSLIHKNFSLAKRDIAAFERESITLDLGVVATNAIECAEQEDSIVFKGNKETPGLLSARSACELKLGLWNQAGSATEDIIKAVTMLDKAGFHGPYSLALEPGRYNMLMKVYPNSFVGEMENIAKIVTEGIVKAPAVQNGGVLIASGKQYASIILGQDMSVGYIGPVDEKLQFSISESLALYLRQPLAVCILKE